MGILAWLKEKLFIRDLIDFELPGDRRIHDSLSEPKSCPKLREELNLKKQHAYKRLRILMDRGLVMKRDGIFSQTDKRPALRLRPKVWLNGAAVAGLLVSIGINNQALTLFSLLSAALNSVSLKESTPS